MNKVCTHINEKDDMLRASGAAYDGAVRIRLGKDLLGTPRAELVRMINVGAQGRGGGDDVSQSRDAVRKGDGRDSMGDGFPQLLLLGDDLVV